MKVRQATVEDASSIATICYNQFQSAHKEGLAPDDLIYYVEKTFNRKALEEDLSDPGKTCFIAVNNDIEIVGCINLQKIALPQAVQDKSAIEITRLYLSPSEIGKGVGAALMQKAISFAQDQQKKSIWLHVYKGNETAIQFYKKQGFNIVGELDFPVRQSCPVGWVMMREL